MAKAKTGNAENDGAKKDGAEKQDGKPRSPADQYIVKDPELFARNLARIMEEASKAASAWSQPRERGETRDTVSEPTVDMIKTLSRLTEYWLSDPTRALEAQTRLFSGYLNIWSNAVRRNNGEADAGQGVTPEKGDKRFLDSEWGDNAFFDFLKQTYLITSKWAGELVDNADGLDEHTRQKANFYVKQIAHAVSPSNFILTNPELFRETVESHGENLVRGMRMLGEDITAGKGDLRLRQADYTQFEVGRNLATTPGKVVARGELAEIIQYEPTTKDVLKRPLLIVPPWINKYYILDLNEKKSFIRWAVAQGHTVFVVSWVNPDSRHGRKDWDDYIREGIEFGLETIEKTTGERQVNAIGYCVGGTLLAAALASMAQNGDARIASATFFTTQVDFTHAGDLKVFVDEEQVTAVEQSMKEKGFLEGNKMATAFNMLRAGDLIWPYVVNNYVRGKEPLPFDLLYWNSDSTRMGAANHSYYLRNCYLENNLSRGKAVLRGQTLSLSDIKIPVFNLATKDDHIAPARSVFVGSGFFGGDVEFVMTGSGHIAGVVNPPSINKYQFWTGRRPAGSFDEWVADANENPGSWWPFWQAWIEQQGGEQVSARELGNSKKSELPDAPGDYVRQRV